MMHFFRNETRAEKAARLQSELAEMDSVETDAETAPRVPRHRWMGPGRSNEGVEAKDPIENAGSSSSSGNSGYIHSSGGGFDDDDDEVEMFTQRSSLMASKADSSSTAQGLLSRIWPARAGRVRGSGGVVDRWSVVDDSDDEEDSERAAAREAARLEAERAETDIDYDPAFEKRLLEMRAAEGPDGLEGHFPASFFIFGATNTFSSSSISITFHIPAATFWCPGCAVAGGVALAVFVAMKTNESSSGDDDGPPWATKASHEEAARNR